MGVGSTDDTKNTGDPAEGGEGQGAEGSAVETTGETPAEDASEAAAETAQLDLKDADERLPWLESDDDGEDEAESGAGRVVAIVLASLGILALLVGAIWYTSHRTGGTEQVAEGGVIKAPAEPYKEAPENPGGKTFAGTGDSSFAVSEGQTRPARLGRETGAAKPAATPSTAAAAEPAAPVSGVGVQIAAYSNEAQAKAGWDRLSQQHEALKGMPHRIQQGTADIGTVYRLQAVTPDAAAAQALCAKLKAAGLACQVKN